MNLKILLKGNLYIICTDNETYDCHFTRYSRGNIRSEECINLYDGIFPQVSHAASGTKRRSRVDIGTVRSDGRKVKKRMVKRGNEDDVT